MRARTGALSLVVAGLAILTGCGSGAFVACHPVGYLYVGPIEPRLGAALPEDVTVAACFGGDCDPDGVGRDPDGLWLVPQDAEYFSDGDETWLQGDVSDVRVVVSTSSGEVVHDDVHPVPRVTETVGLCPGPFHYEPVEVP